MRKQHIIVCLLILAVLLSGCVGEKAVQQPVQTPEGEGIQGNISVPGEKDLLVEEPLSSEDENVDMGSLI